LGVAVGGARGGGVSNDIFGYLIDESGAGIGGKTVRILIDNKDMQHVSTRADGRFSYPFHFELGKYNIQAVFDGEAPCNASAYGKMQNGTSYTIGTTIQYGLKYAVDSTSLTVETHSTTAVKPTKTPEQMQQEAEQSGWLTVWHEFTWSYPWYRLHIQFNVNGATIHIGSNPVLPGGEIGEAQDLGKLVKPTNAALDPNLTLEQLEKVVREMIESSVVDLLALALSILIAMHTRNLLLVVGGIVFYIVMLLYLGHHALNDLYNSGFKNAGRAFMAGIWMGLAGVLFTTLFGLVEFSGATIVTTNVIFAMVGSLISNSYDPKPTNDFVRMLIIGLLVAVGTAAAGLKFEPIGRLYYFLFLSVTMSAMFIAWDILGDM
jgi:uncharacterized membrane protein